MNKTSQKPMADILHLSDLHFGTVEDGNRWYGQLADDLKLELGCEKLDAMIISGDVANKSEPGEYEAAKIFIKQTASEFGLSPRRIVIVPGNHDLNWKISRKKGYRLTDRDDLEAEPGDGCFIPVDDEVIRIRADDGYRQRFRHFAKFYQDVKGEEYPEKYAGQGILHDLGTHKILILGFNSAWEIDHHFKSRASINPDAAGNALQRAGRDNYRQHLKFAVWHHSLENITDRGFLERLAQNDFSVCFHGHIHKSETGLFKYDHNASGRKIRIVGAGTFGAPVRAWHPGHPLQYNLVRITGNRLTVETRRRTEINGTWMADAIWKQGPGKDPLPRYSFKLPSGLEESVPIPKIPEPIEIHVRQETDISLYLEKIRSLHEKIPLSGFRTPVTNEEYGRFLAEHPDAEEPKFWSDSRYNHARQPVVGVSWYEAKKYADWAGLQLPTEPQWEYACRAGTTTRYHTGDAETDLDRAGWYRGNSEGRLHSVGEKEPNGFGLYDMHGNVREWTGSLHKEYPYDPGDGREDMSGGGYRVLRGGSWFTYAWVCRSAYRDGFRPGYRDDDLGFRLVRLH